MPLKAQQQVTVMRTNDVQSNDLPFHKYDARYVLIGKREACAILGMPPSSFDRARKDDPRFPLPIQQGRSANAPLRFVLAEVYTYSAQLINDFRHQDTEVA